MIDVKVEETVAVQVEAVTLNLPKETLEVGRGIAKLLHELKGDVNVMEYGESVMSSLAELKAAVTGISQVPAEFKASPVEATIAISAGLAEYKVF
jgi:hypothetical protein